AVADDRAGIRRVDRADQVQQGRLARTRFTVKPDELAGPHSERDVVGGAYPAAAGDVVVLADSAQRHRAGGAGIFGHVRSLLGYQRRGNPGGNGGTGLPYLLPSDNVRA